MNLDWNEVGIRAENWPAELVLRWAFLTFGTGVAISSAFGAEGMAVIHMASQVSPKFRLFTLDTDFLFPETYALMQEVEQRYGIKIERVHSHFSPEQQAQVHGPALWKRDPDLCCDIRKVQPLRSKLAELSAWITSIRRDQTFSRAGAQKIHWDSKFGLVKINPIADWDSRQVWRYIHQHRIPYNPLYDRGYASIGCTHCTRAIAPGEDPRAGRWSGFAKTECGLHENREPAPASPLQPSQPCL